MISIWQTTPFTPSETGLKVKVWIYVSSYHKDSFVRIKVSSHYGQKVYIDDGVFTITVSDKQIIGDTGEIKTEDIESVKKWIDMNHDDIILFWKGEIDTKDFCDILKKY